MSFTRTLTVVIAFALGLGPAALSLAEEKRSPQADASPGLVVAQTKGGEPSAGRSKDGRVHKKKDGKRDAPQYKPPRRGRAWRTIGGATRGSETCRPVIAVLAPHDHSGLTSREQPTLYWYLSDTCPSSIEFTFIEANGIAPLVEISLTAPQNAGLQALDLAQHGVTLKVGTLYAWSIAFVPDREHRSKDIFAQGGILRVEPGVEVSARLAAASKEHVPDIYAEAGLWYDALSELSAMIQTNPSNHELRRQRALLLEQVQLVHVAGHEAALADANPG